MHPVLRPFLKYYLYVKPEIQSAGATFRHDMPTQVEEGANQKSQEATRVLRDWDKQESHHPNQCGESAITARRDTSFTTDEYVSTEL